MNKDLTPSEPKSFAEIAKLIQERLALAVRKVDTELTELYWEVGRIISQKLESAERGDKAIDELAKYLKQHEPSLRGFARRNLYQMRQFYEVYPEDGIVSALPTQLSWTHNLSIICKVWNLCISLCVDTVSYGNPIKVGSYPICFKTSDTFAKLILKWRFHAI